jgi:hypothetical protein
MPRDDNEIGLSTSHNQRTHHTPLDTYHPASLSLSLSSRRLGVWWSTRDRRARSRARDEHLWRPLRHGLADLAVLESPVGVPISNERVLQKIIRHRSISWILGEAPVVEKVIGHVGQVH